MACKVKTAQQGSHETNKVLGHTGNGGEAQLCETWQLMRLTVVQVTLSGKVTRCIDTVFRPNFSIEDDTRSVTRGESSPN